MWTRARWVETRDDLFRSLLAMGGSRPLRSYLALKRERAGWITSGKASIRHLPLPFGTPLTGCYVVCTEFL
jgi:hypothetical protein